MQRDAQDLVIVLRHGALPAPIEMQYQTVVGPTLGADSIKTSLEALGFGALLVIILMSIYYRGSGVISVVALFLNVLFVTAALASLGATLTLPGIAGIILTIGMAVDANVIIFERIKEELRAGKSPLNAVKEGFSHSYSAIIDANVTTLLVGFILAYFGVGPIKGFAVVLIWGVIFSFITAVWVTRLIIDYWNSKGRGFVSYYRPSTANILANLNFDWLGQRKKTYYISLGVILLGLISIFVRGWELGVDFKGGYSYNVEFPEDATVSIQELSDVLSDVFEATPIVKSIDIGNH